MNEKRFVCIDIGYGDDWYITDNGKRLSEMEIVDLLNEQQATITHLEKVFGINFAKRRLLERDNLVLRNENERLRKQCLELEKDYVIETSDISDKIYLDDEIKELKQKYGVKDE